MAKVIREIKTAIKESENKIMSQLSELKGTLEAVEAKLEAIDTAVKALVAASANVTLDADTQAALDKVVAEVGTIATDSGTPS